MIETAHEISDEAQQDRELAEQFLAGNEQAFNQLVLKYQDMAYTVALRLVGNPEDACEIAQDAFVRMYRSLPRFKWNCAFKSWLYTIVLNCARSRYRKLSRHNKVVATSLDKPIAHDDGRETTRDVPDVSLAPDKAAQQHEMRQVVEAGLLQLDSDYREVMVLRFIEDLSYDEIADVLKLNQGTVKSRIHRARTELKKILKRLLSR